jgi:hypothetical protein
MSANKVVHSVVDDLEAVQDLPVPERVQLLEAFGAAGPHTVEQFELRALASTGTPEMKRVISELFQLQTAFRSATNNREEAILVDAIHDKRQELAALQSTEGPAVEKAHEIIVNLQATNLLVDDGHQHLCPSAIFPTPEEIESAF